MLEQKEHFHGSDLEKIEKYYGIKKEDIISFSANVNPLGISPKLRENLASQIDVITTYPDREYKSLRKAIGKYCNCDYHNIMVGNGATELISLFIQIVSPKNTLLLGPTYSEYERDLKLNGSSMEYYLLREKDNYILNVNDFISHITTSIDMVIICNPNNPTSSLIERPEMEQILHHCQSTNTYVMVDETYAEFAPDVEAISAIALCDKYDNLMVLRGTSKFFAAPGLRLGYAITGSPEILTTINTKKNPWMINSLAAVAGETMFLDIDYIAATRIHMDKERVKMMKLFSASSKFKTYPSYGNFMLLQILDESLDSSKLFEKCIRQNLMIRDCSTFPGMEDRFIRFCFMSSDADDRLAKCLLED